MSDIHALAFTIALCLMVGFGFACCIPQFTKEAFGHKDDNWHVDLDALKKSLTYTTEPTPVELMEADDVLNERSA